ncbi:MAG: hypothetical protein KDJ44_05070 [Rhodoblastus sp.]|nr:hypothetical protein [Rhodoblastus sp.]
MNYRTYHVVGYTDGAPDQRFSIRAMHDTHAIDTARAEALARGCKRVRVKTETAEKIFDGFAANSLHTPAEDHVSIRLAITASFIMTLQAGSKPITRAAIAENLDALIHEAGGIEPFLCDIEIDNVQIDEVDQIAQA